MDGTHRMIDANANRCREALRVMEDVARFVLNDGELATESKACRHELRGALEALGLDALRLAASRDTPGDVGTRTTTPSEARRGSIGAVALAAGKRAGEALRVLEEMTKLESGGRSAEPARASAAEAPAWGRIKALRYRVYEAERRVVMALGASAGGADAGGARATEGRDGAGEIVGRQWRLCVLLTEKLCRRPWLEVAGAALEGGADCLQLREKELDGGELVARTRQLLELARTHGLASGGARASVIVNDRADVALAAGADGVHVGQGDLSPTAVRGLAGARLLVGVSTHDMGEAQRAVREGADVCGVGAMFGTSTKPRAASGAAYLREYLAEGLTARVPHLAIGGITAENVGLLAEAGCRGVAVSAAVCGAADPAGACAAILKGLGSGCEGARGDIEPKGETACV